MCFRDVYANHIVQQRNIFLCENISLLIALSCCVLIKNCSKVQWRRSVFLVHGNACKTLVNDLETERLDHV